MSDNAITLPLLESIIQIEYEAWSMVPERKTSPEVDYGVNWLINGPGKLPLFPAWRVSWVEKTSELYATPTADQRDRFVILGHYKTAFNFRPIKNILSYFIQYFR